MRKRICSIVLAAALGVSLLAGCGNAGADNTSAETPAAAEQDAETPAAGKVPLMGAGTSDIWATSFGWWTGVANSDIVCTYPDFNEKVLAGELKWTDPVIVESLTNWQKLINAGYYHKGSMSFSYIQASEEFKNGSAAMFMDGAWSAAGYDNGGFTEDQIGVFIVPAPTGAKSYCTMPQYWGVAETCEHGEYSQLQRRRTDCHTLHKR